ncbi:hypothetical protein MYAM1_003299 [Malassezia yamatoensis]|uniref:Uncharacterized protein n=1 Tax=Malassezia yamatoensis TaxID=253288 RepID=A0AAJ5YUB3_9BASI|nr:hypothetical protein MYAM1_003299 [Malassezia yamatoensis]
MDLSRSCSAQMDSAGKRRPPLSASRSGSSFVANSRKERASQPAHPRVVRAQTTPVEITRSIQDTDFSPGQSQFGPYTKPGGKNSQRAFQGTVRVADAGRYTNNDTPPSRNSVVQRSSTSSTPTDLTRATVGTGARVVKTSSVSNHAGKPWRNRSPTPSSSQLPLHSSIPTRNSTPNNDEQRYQDKLVNVSRSPTSPTNDVRSASRRSPSPTSRPRRSLHARLPPESPPRPGTSMARIRASEISISNMHRTSDTGSRTSKNGGSSVGVSTGSATGSMADSPASSVAVGSPFGATSHPFTRHIANTSSAPVTSTPLTSRLESSQLSTESDTLNIYDAKQARKVLDLEISNKSLLAINANLESTKLEQTKEIRTLRKQMLHTQLENATDPSQIFALETNGGSESLNRLLTSVQTSDAPTLPQQVAHAIKQQDDELQQFHTRMHLTMDTLLEEAREAILSRSEYEVSKSRVLHASELLPLSTSHESFSDTSSTVDSRSQVQQESLLESSEESIDQSDSSEHPVATHESTPTMLASGTPSLFGRIGTASGQASNQPSASIVPQSQEDLHDISVD